MIDRSTIDRILSTANIVEVVGDFVQLKKKGTNYTACCPFHNEKTPSFMVSPARGIFKCFGCGKAGSAVNFVMEHEKMDFIDAIRWLGKKYGIQIEEKELSAEEKARQDNRESMMVLTKWAQEYFSRQLEVGDGLTIGKSYFQRRGFTDETIKKAGLGYCPDGGNVMTNAALKAGFRSEFLISTGLSLKNEASGELYDRFRGRIMFPILSISGRVIGFGGRTLRTDKKVAKYQNSPESDIYHKSSSLYGIYMAKQSIISKDLCILVEGYADVLQMHQRGITNVVASSGTSLTKEQIQLIKRFTSNIIVIYDGDSAGIKASLRSIDLILEAGMNVKSVLLPDGKDPDDFARENNITYIEGFLEENEEDFISFKIRMLLGENPDDPQQRQETIKSITQSIAVIPDAINRSVYIRTCAKKLDISETTIENEVSRIRAGLIDGPEGREVWQNNKRKQDYLRRQEISSDKGNGLTVSSVATIQKAQRGELEKELIGYLIKHGDTFIDIANPSDPDDIYTFSVFDFILHEISVSEITFAIPECKEILEIALRHWNEETPFTAQELITSPNPAVSRLISEILFSDDQWSEEEVSEEGEIVNESNTAAIESRAREIEIKSNLSIAIPKAMILYKAAFITDKITEMTSKVKALESEGNSEEVMRIMNSIRELSSARAILMNRCNRVL